MMGVAYFLTLARYNVWATRRLLDALAAVDDAAYRRDIGLFFRSIHGTLNHLLVAEHRLWFRRFAEGVRWMKKPNPIARALQSACWPARQAGNP